MLNSSLSVSSDEEATYKYIRDLIFFSNLILPQAKSISLIAIYKLEHEIPLTENETYVLNEHLLFINKLFS